MSAFSAAVATLHADTNLSIACTWSYGWDRAAGRTLALDFEAETYALEAAAVSLRGIQAQPEQPTFGAQRGAVVPRRELDLAAADLPARAMRGDLITIGADAFVVEIAELDIEGVTWRLTLSES